MHSNSVYICVVLFACTFGLSVDADCDVSKLGKCVDKLENADNISISKAVILGSSGEDLQTLFQATCSSHKTFVNCMGEQSANDCIPEIFQANSSSEWIVMLKWFLKAFKFVCQDKQKEVILRNMDCAKNVYHEIENTEKLKSCIKRLNSDWPTTIYSTEICNVIPKIYQDCFREELESKCGQDITQVICQAVDFAVADYNSSHKCSTIVTACNQRN